MRRRLAFTLLELLTVIAIIAILIGFLFVSFRHVRNASARAATKVALSSLTNMLSDYEAANHFTQAPVMWNWGEAGGIAAYPQTFITPGTWTVNEGAFGTQHLFADFWNHPFSLKSPTDSTVTWEAQDNPANVAEDSGNFQRYCANSILDTQIALQMLASLPSNRAIFSKLPANQVMYLPYEPVGSGVLYNSTGDMPKDDGSDGSLNFSYSQGTHVTSNGRYYVSLKYTNDPVSNTGSWYDETNALRGVPLLLDGWGNPILFVPGSGIHVRLLNGKGKYDPTDPTEDFVIVSPEGHVTIDPSNRAYPIVDKPGRPFFVSAGPDGDFVKGDDNIYSFEN